VFNPPSTVEPNTIDHAIDIALGGFRRWDAVYFLHIAEHGYTYENTLAFFPLFPLMVRTLANSALYPLQFCMSYASVLLISAVSVNITCFVLSAVTLYELGRTVLGSNVVAYRAAQFYCINPANVFFSAAYSESCYALLAFRGMLLLERGLWTSAALSFALSCAARSNGLVNVGFLLHRFARDMVALYFRSVATVSFSRVGLKLCRISTLLTICAAPFAAFQYHAYTVFCNQETVDQDVPEHIRLYGAEMGYKMPLAGPSVWCAWKLPLSYSYIQSSHWNVGFLSYYELKQIPNFLLATPMAVLCLCAMVSYASKHMSCCLYSGLMPENYTDDANPDKYHFLPKNCFVYIVHMSFLLTIGLLFMHVQVHDTIGTLFFMCILFLAAGWIPEGLIKLPYQWTPKGFSLDFGNH